MHVNTRSVLKKRFILGFTLLELIIVLVLIAVLASVAIPRFINQTTAAQQNSTNSLAGALSAAGAENFAKRSANSALGYAVTNCTSASNLLTPIGLPSGYAITSRTVSANATVTCTLTGSGGTTATFVALGIA